MLLIVGAAVISEAPLNVEDGVSRVKPHSVENVISWSHSDTVTLDASPVSIVAHTLVVVGVYAVSQRPAPPMVVV
jgi:hypothetical protein